ncbi:hypothetical protein MC28_F201 (plasmid) [Bacillus thuringiensis MC28]|nr:hypothetical protein MC28_F201 [Bacillus thuringiensis MC28]
MEVHGYGDKLLKNYLLILELSYLLHVIRFIITVIKKGNP